MGAGWVEGCALIFVNQGFQFFHDSIAVHENYSTKKSITLR